jgi:hypothetical protein
MALFSQFDRLPFGRIILLVLIVATVLGLGFLLPPNPTILHVNGAIAGLSALVCWSYRSTLMTFLRGGISHGAMCIGLGIFVSGSATDIRIIWSSWMMQYHTTVPAIVVAITGEMYLLAFMLWALAPAAEQKKIPASRWYLVVAVVTFSMLIVEYFLPVA